MDEFPYPFDVDLKLAVIGQDKIVPPGCEPSSGLSSLMLGYSMRKDGCTGGLVPLKKALAAIPGSWVQFGVNYNTGVRQKWFVLPPRPWGCPCTSYPDWYRILRSLAEMIEPDAQKDECGVNSHDLSCGFNFEPKDSPPSTYFQEGSGNAPGVLPLIPPWAIK